MPHPIPNITGKQYEAACAKVKRHYRLSRVVTAAEVHAEIVALCRRGPLAWDDMSQSLAAALQTGKAPINLGFDTSEAINAAFYD